MPLATRLMRGCFALALIALPVCAGNYDSLSPDDLVQLSKGEAVVHVSEDVTGQADAVIMAAIKIPTSPARLFSLMLDCRRSVQYVTGLKSCKVLEASPDGLSEIREHRSQWGALFPETVSVFRADYVLNREIKFERVRGDLRYLKGAWHMEPESGGKTTRLTYESRIGVNILMPSLLIRSTLADDIKKLLMALRAEVQK
ncbi:MAG: hypothetical protein CTY31_02460 [Hyphomicrobium sp.]|nr:MAG: hypothetical protein CTY39_06635 [Hyphomicrobium sp.]PPD01633.1 MAG: hypothetical protein CTY31_02460 [Hyphomicrobium sp.]